jgi:hypothetical protein
LLRVLSLKGFLSGSLEQVTPMSLPLTTFAHSLPEIHMALLFAAARSFSMVKWLGESQVIGARPEPAR